MFQKEFATPLYSYATVLAFFFLVKNQSTCNYIPPNNRSNGHLNVTHTGNFRTNVCAELRQKLSNRRRQRGKGGHRKNKPRRRGGGAGVVFKATRGTGGKKKRDSRFKQMHEITTRGQEVRWWKAGERARGLKGGAARRRGWGEARIRERRAGWNVKSK